MAALPTPLPTPVETGQPVLLELEEPPIPIIGAPVERVRNTLSGIASSPRKRMTLIIIQAFTILFALSVFGYLIARRR